MKKPLGTALAALVLLTIGTTALFADEQPPQTEFVFNLYRTVVKDKANDNVAVSPYGLQQMLDLLRFGAAGDTKTEIEKVIGYTETFKWASLVAAPLPLPRDRSAMGNVIPGRIPATPQEGPLTTAASVWTQKDYPFLPEYLKIATDNFGATIEQADFVANSDDAVKRINDWCSEKTNKKIPVLFDEIDPMTRMILVGAIHFLADWQTPFNKNMTRDDDFTPLNGAKVKTKLMSQQSRFQYGETAESLILELPYQNEGYAMLLLMPKKPADFAKWESEMTLEKWTALRKSMKNEEVNVLMPRFTMESTMALNELLKSMGMPTAFIPNDADFSKIDGSRNLFVGTALQKTYVKVDETGTEVAAVTGIGMMATSAMIDPPKPKEFHADRPFLYAIVKGNSILFLGRFVKPGAE